MLELTALEEGLYVDLQVGTASAAAAVQHRGDELVHGTDRLELQPNRRWTRGWRRPLRALENCCRGTHHGSPLGRTDPFSWGWGACSCSAWRAGVLDVHKHDPAWPPSPSFPREGGDPHLWQKRDEVPRVDLQEEQGHKRHEEKQHVHYALHDPAP